MFSGDVKFDVFGSILGVFLINWNTNCVSLMGWDMFRFMLYKMHFQVTVVSDVQGDTSLSRKKGEGRK